MKPYFILFFLTCTLGAYDDRPACYKELERNFFQQKTVGEALALWNVNQSQGQWAMIVKLIQSKQKDAEYVINEKARSFKPNPLQNPFKSDDARDLLKETMYQIFERALLESGFFDTLTIGKMFEYVWMHDPRIKKCMPESNK